MKGEENKHSLNVVGKNNNNSEYNSDRDDGMARTVYLKLLSVCFFPSMFIPISSIILYFPPLGSMFLVVLLLAKAHTHTHTNCSSSTKTYFMFAEILLVYFVFFFFRFLFSLHSYFSVRFYQFLSLRSTLHIYLIVMVF